MSAAQLDDILRIPASGIALAAGSSLIGEAVGGPVGAVVFAVGGALMGAYAEMASQRRQHTEFKDVPDQQRHE